MLDTTLCDYNLKLSMDLFLDRKLILQDLDTAKSKLEEGQIPAILLETYNNRVERLKEINELQVSKIEKVESSKLDFCQTCEDKSL